MLSCTILFGKGRDLSAASNAYTRNCFVHFYESVVRCGLTSQTVIGIIFPPPTPKSADFTF